MTTIKGNEIEIYLLDIYIKKKKSILRSQISHPIYNAPVKYVGILRLLSHRYFFSFIVVEKSSIVFH